MKFKLEELKAALAELEARSKVVFIEMEFEQSRLIISCDDQNKDRLEVVLYHNSNLGAQFKMTHRLMYMENKKRID